MRTAWTFAILLLAAGTKPVPAGETPGGAPGAAGTAVLDLDRGSIRVFVRRKIPSLVTADGKTVPLLEPLRRGTKEEDRKPWPVVASPAPPEGWTQPGFDDSSWPRVRGQVVAGGRHDDGLITPGNPAEWQTICVRAKFRVTAPGQVGNLRLQLGYHGGAVVYLNGTEVARGHVPAGELDPDAAAQVYPDEAYLRPDGKTYGKDDWRKQDLAERMKARVRTLPAAEGAGAVTVPASALRQGVNVLAVEIRAAAVRDLAVTAPLGDKGRAAIQFAHAALVELRLLAGSPAGLVPNAGPSPAIELWNCQPVETLAVWDFADPVEEPFPVRIVGALNGVFSGRVVLSSAGSIRNLKVSCSDLVAEKGGGKIPASAVELRRSEPAAPEQSWAGPERFDRLVSDFPAEIAPVKITLRRAKVQPEPAAVVPVWVTVRVPADAAPGEYRGTLSVSAQGGSQADFKVPVHLVVHGWKVPDPREFVTHHHLYQSPETVALYYKVPLWSEEHWGLVGKSLEVLGQVANKICVANLTAKVPNLNNAESMVRWVKKQGPGAGGQVPGGTEAPDTRNPTPGTYSYDFSILERYMDIYAQKCGKPGVLCLNLWAYFNDKKDDRNNDPPLAVTVVDEGGQKLADLNQPPYGTPENEAFWKPVLTDLRARLEKRGWFDTAMVCYASYCWLPTAKVVDEYHNIWADGKWMNSSHGGPTQYKGTNVVMPVPCSESVWGVGRLYCPDKAALYPQDRHIAKEFPSAWKKGAERIHLGIPRVGTGFINVLRDRSPLSMYRTVTELTVQGGIRGVGRVGGDFWPLLQKDQRGRVRLVPMCDGKYAIGPINNVTSMTSPGPEGAAFNERLEMFREGVQVAEAIVFLQRAMEGGKLSADLAGRIKALLDERARWNLRTRADGSFNDNLPMLVTWLALESSGWQERDDRLFALATDAAAAAK